MNWIIKKEARRAFYDGAWRGGNLCLYAGGYAGGGQRRAAESTEDTGAQVVATLSWATTNRIALVERMVMRKLMRWDKTILTDSGAFGYLVQRSPHFRRRCHLSFRAGSVTLLTPERSMEIQRSLGADIVMALTNVSSHMRKRNMSPSHST